MSKSCEACLVWQIKKGRYMEDVRVLEIKQSVFANNDAHADELRERLRAQGTFLLNLMSSPGSGKTTTLARTISSTRAACATWTHI